MAADGGVRTQAVAALPVFRRLALDLDWTGNGGEGAVLARKSSMDAKTKLKSRLPSRHATEGAERAPHRAFYYAMGLTQEQIHQPFVGVATCWNEAAPCNIALMRQAQAVKLGVAAVGATPREFCTITVTDGIAMGHAGMKSSLPSREVIADSVELTVRGHSYDALIGVAGCDKSQPGMMMAMCRLNVPSIFIYGGSILPGTFKGQPVTIQDVYEAVGKHSIGAMSDADLDTLEQNACPSAGACGAQFTANTMATVSEAIGLALPYSAGAPAPYEIRDKFCMLAGEMIMDLIVKNIRPRDIVTRKALENAAAVVAATGGSTNGALHLPAIANECGIKFDLFDVAEVLQKDTLYRGFETVRPLCRQRHVRSWRRSAFDEDAARPRLPPWRVSDRHRPHHGREPEIGEVERGSGRCSPGRQADPADRRRHRSQR